MPASPPGFRRPLTLWLWSLQLLQLRGAGSEGIKGRIGEGEASSLHFRFFFAFSGSTAEFAAAPGDDGFEEFGVIRTGLANNAVGGRFGIDGLEAFLEIALGIGLDEAISELVELSAEHADDKLRGGIQPGIDVNGPDDGFERIGERGIPLAAAAGLLATAHDEVRAEADLTGEAGERFGAHQMGAGLREAAFIGIGQPGEKLMAEGELEDGITEEFEALVVEAGALRLVAYARMREGLSEESELAEGVAEDALKGFHVSLFADSPR